MCFIILQITTHISLSIFCFPSKIVCLLAFNSAFTNRRALFTSRCVFRFSIQSLPIKVRMIPSTTAVKLHTKSPILRFLKRSVIFSTVLFSFYHSLISFLLRLFITLILIRNSLSISFCYVSGAKLLLFDNMPKIFVTFCLEKRDTITFLHITTYLIFHFGSINHINHYRITQREKNKIKALIPQKSLRSERAGQMDKHHTAIPINTMKV